MEKNVLYRRIRKDLPCFYIEEYNNAYLALKQEDSTFIKMSVLQILMILIYEENAI